MVSESERKRQAFAHAARVRVALDLIESAQRLVNEAARELCSVPGYSDEWGRVCRLYDQVKGEWHQIEQRVIASAIREGGRS